MGSMFARELRVVLCQRTVPGRQNRSRLGRACAIVLTAGVILQGCTTLSAPQPGDVVHVADIINSVKCGLAEALQSEAGRRRLPGTIATVELSLKVVDSRAVNVNSPSPTGPVIFAWFGPSLLPTLNATDEQSFAVDTTINLTYKLDAPSYTVCQGTGVDKYDKLGFARWLGDVISGLSKVSLDGPRGNLDKLTYDATFAVARSASAGGSVQIVFLTAGATGSKSRADTQHLKIVISGAAGIATSPDVPPALRGALLRGTGPVQNLSTAKPAAQ